MESSKLKNIVLVILLITNALLLALMTYQRVESRQYQQQALLDAVALLEQKGISADPSLLPKGDFPAPMTLERNTAWEQELFTDLLGEDTALTQRGLVSYYTGALGTAEVRSDGGFSVAFAPGSYPLAQGEDVGTHAVSLVQRLGFTAHLSAQDAARVTVTQAYTQSGSRVCFPVFSCAVTVEYRDGQAVSMAGTRLVGKPTADSQQSAPLSTAALLVRFRAGIIDSGDACTAILSATQGYTLRANAAGQLHLVPVLRLETDTSLYFLDALTGALSRV